MRYYKQTAALTVLLLMLCGCGQRGPLYLPESPPKENKPADASNLIGSAPLSIGVND